MKTCKKGHERTDSEIRCNVCAKERSRQWAAKNKDRVAHNQKTWCEVNKDKVRAHKKEVYLASKETIQASRKAFYTAHRERLVAVRARYRLKNRSKCLAFSKKWHDLNRDRRNNLSRLAYTKNPLSNSHVAHALGLRVSEAPVILIEAKRAHLKLKRLLKEMQK